MSLIEEFLDAFAPFPDRARKTVLPYLLALLDETEMRLIVAMKKESDDPISAETISKLMEMNEIDTRKLIEKGIVRGVLKTKKIDEETRYFSTMMPRRLFTYVTFEEGWSDIPLNVRKILSEWMHRVYYYERYKPMSEKMKRGETVQRLPNEDILLLDEVLEMVDAAHDFAVIKCNCRALDQHCDYEVESCIRFDHEAIDLEKKGLGKKLTKEETRELIIQLNKAGHIHTGSNKWREEGLGHLCNCCNCCCYPFRAGVELGLEKMWPRSHFVANYDEDKCIQCGLCVRRCQFGAYTNQDEINYDPEKCWGCGLCSDTCPSKAITMISLGH
jgi:NAD-dependent dihydropyrimidine dehydrogenase PreA subunit